MSKETVNIETTVDTTVPAFLKRIPVKKLALATLVVVGLGIAAKVASDRVDVDVDVVEDETPKA